MKVSISQNPETIGKKIAQTLVDEIDKFVPTEGHEQMIVGLSWGRTIERIITNFVELCRIRREEGHPVDTGKVLFLQTESFWPENPDSKSNMMANQLRVGFEDKLREIGQEVSVYYPGAEPTAEAAAVNFSNLSQQMYIDLVTIHESGAVKGLRDADQVDGEIRWAAGQMGVKDIQWRALENIRGGEDVTINPKVEFERVPKDIPQNQAIVKYLAMIQQAIDAGDQTAKIPQFFISEGYKGYKNAGKVFIVTEGENKRAGVKRLFSHIRLEDMTIDEQSKISRERIESQEGVVSGSTIIDIRRGCNTELSIDSAAAADLDLHLLQENGIEVDITDSIQESAVKKEAVDYYGQIGLEGRNPR